MVFFSSSSRPVLLAILLMPLFLLLIFFLFAVGWGPFQIRLDLLFFRIYAFPQFPKLAEFTVDDQGNAGDDQLSIDHTLKLVLSESSQPVASIFSQEVFHTDVAEYGIGSL